MIEKLIISDFDGTLANNQCKISPKVHDYLKNLKTKSAISAIATGRSLFSAYQVLPLDFPIDYLIFSSGAGLMNWKTKEILYTSELNSQENKFISQYLNQSKIDFMIHQTIPDNHYFDYFNENKDNNDFTNRISFYKEFANKKDFNTYHFKTASQILAIEKSDPNKYFEIKRDLKDFSVVRTTSPLNKHSIWIEIFKKDVCKSTGAKYLSELLNINRENIMFIGNDYNDLDLLEWSIHAYLVENAPKLLQGSFKIVASNDNDGFCEAVDDFLKLSL